MYNLFFYDAADMFISWVTGFSLFSIPCYIYFFNNNVKQYLM